VSSSNGMFHLTMQSDGNLVVRNTYTGQAIWSTQTSGNRQAYAILRSDGLYVQPAYAPQPGKAVWNSNPTPGEAVRLEVTDTGCAEIQSNRGTAYLNPACRSS